GHGRVPGTICPPRTRPRSRSTSWPSRASSSSVASRPGPAGTRLGVVLAYAWSAYPYTAFALESNSNDTLVAVLVIGALLLLLALAVAVVPRRRDLRQVAALGAAVMLAAELCADHWFYLYIPWFFPLVAVALAAAPAREVAADEAREQVAAAESSLPAAAPA